MAASRFEQLSGYFRVSQYQGYPFRGPYKKDYISNYYMVTVFWGLYWSPSFLGSNYHLDWPVQHVLTIVVVS